MPRGCAEFFATLLYVCAASGTIFLLLGNNWINNHSTSLAPFLTLPSSNPLAAKEIQQSSNSFERHISAFFMTPMRDQCLTSVGQDIKRGFLPRFTFLCLGYHLWKIGWWLLPVAFSPSPAFQKRRWISFINADRVHGDLQIKRLNVKQNILFYLAESLCFTISFQSTYWHC